MGKQAQQAERGMNELLTSQPVLVLTGAGASKWLGKATTFDIYESKEFRQHTQLGRLTELRSLLLERTPDDPVDLEFLLDYILKLTAMFDELKEIPQFQGHMNNLMQERDRFEEAHEQALDFMLDYYGSIDEQAAVSLYKPFFGALRDILAGTEQRNDVISLFTLNYDEAVETAVDALSAEGASKYELNDGFGSGHRRFWEQANLDSVAPARGSVQLVLLKLHGSVSWTRTGPTSRIEKTPDVPRRRPGKQHMVLFPTRLPKDTSGEPFSTAYQYFRAALQSARLAVFVGTSFRDSELLDAIRDTFERYGPLQLLAVDPHGDATELAARLQLPKRYISTARLSFEPANITRLASIIDARLQKAPPRRRSKR